MSTDNVTQMQKQFDSVMAGPARTYASLMLDHLEQLTNLQYDAIKSYADTSFQQARAALDVKDPSDVRAYVEGQQKMARELGERAKGDAEKVVSLNQDFVQKAQKVAEESAKNVSKATAQSK